MEVNALIRQTENSTVRSGPGSQARGRRVGAVSRRGACAMRHGRCLVEITDAEVTPSSNKPEIFSPVRHGTLVAAGGAGRSRCAGTSAVPSVGNPARHGGWLPHDRAPGHVGGGLGYALRDRAGRTR